MTGRCLVDWCALYRHYDAEGVLLYVGIARWPGSRAGQHARSAEWWPLSETVEVGWFTSRVQAQAAERRAYTDEWPIFNVSGVPRDEQVFRREWYAANAGTLVAA